MLLRFQQCGIPHIPHHENVRTTIVIKGWRVTFSGYEHVLSVETLRTGDGRNIASPNVRS